MTTRAKTRCGVSSTVHRMQPRNLSRCGRTSVDSRRSRNTSQSHYQAMPESGELAENLNLAREAVFERIVPFEKETVYPYVVASVKCQGVRCYQTGTGPNFQGHVITLCTCKHRMRTFPDVRVGVWIAGFVSSSDMYLGNKLFYLMRVSQTFESHQELWASDSIREETKHEKAAHLNRFGDFFMPTTNSGDSFSAQSYLEPCRGHDHYGDWAKDVDYRNASGPAKLLVGDPTLSFLWDRPVVNPRFQIPRNKKTTLSELFSFPTANG